MQCKFQFEDNGQCEAFALQNEEYCFVHSPTTKEQHREAASKGGSVSRNLEDIQLPPLKIERPLDIIFLLQDTINRIRRVKKSGSMDLRTANAIGYLSSQLLKTIEVAELASRLEIVERYISERNPLTRR